MRIEWTEKLATGVHEIDQQHMALFTRINALLAASELGDARAEMLTLYDFLAEYVIFHFETEEKYMGEAGYPGLKSHADIHREFRQKIQGMRSLFDSKEGAMSVAEMYSTLMVDWWLNHVSKTDKEMGLYLQEKANQSTTF